MNQRRRDFLKVVGGATLAIPAVLATGSRLSFAEELKELPADDMTAKALGYNADASSVDTGAYPKRAGAEGAKQFCSNCILLTQGGLKISGKDGDYGKCSVLPAGLVSMKGWCNSWVQKPGV